MADREVIYRAVAKFSQLMREAKRAEDALDDLADAEDEHAQGAQEATKAQDKQSKSLNDLNRQAERNTRTTRANTRAVQDDARARDKRAQATKREETWLGRLKDASERYTSSVRRQATATQGVSSAQRESANSARSNAKAQSDSGKATSSSDSSVRKYALSLGSARSSSDAYTGALARLRGASKGADTAIGTLGATLQKLSILMIGGGFVKPAIAGISALGAVALGAVSSLASLAGTLAGLLPLMSAVGYAAGGVVASLIGIPGAFKALSKQQKAQKEATQAGTKATKDNTKATRDAKAEAWDLARAKRNVAQANDAVTDAQEDLADSHTAVKRAQEETKDAQEGLNEARKEALKDLVDLREEVERNGPLSEDRARYELLRAKDDYMRALADPNATNVDRAEASLRIKEAEENLKDVLEDNTENQKKLSEAEKKGVDGSDRVVEAKKRVADAEDAVIDAKDRVVDAEDRVADAKWRVKDAEESLRRQRKQNTAAAEQASAEATKLADANNEVEDALANLAPSARKVVMGLWELKDAFTDMRKEAQEAFFAPLVKSGFVDDLEGLIPVLETLLVRSAGAMGQVLADTVDDLTTQRWKDDLASIADVNDSVISSLGKSISPLLEMLRDITIVAGPFLVDVLDNVSESMERMAASVNDARNSGDMAAYFDKLSERASIWWKIIKNTGLSLFNIGKVFTEWADGFILPGLLRITRRWKKVTEAQNESGSTLKTFLEDIEPLLTNAGEAVGDFFKWFGKEAVDTSNIEEANSMISQMRDTLGPALADLFDAFKESGASEDFVVAMTNLVEGITTIVESGAGGEGLNAFINTLAELFKALGWLLKFPGAAEALGTIAAGLGAIKAVKFVSRGLGISAGLRWLNEKGLIKRMLGFGRAAPGVAAGLAGISAATMAPAIIPPGVSGDSGPVSAYPPMGVAEKKPGRFKRFTKRLRSDRGSVALPGAGAAGATRRATATRLLGRRAAGAGIALTTAQVAAGGIEQATKKVKPGMLRKVAGKMKLGGVGGIVASIAGMLVGDAIAGDEKGTGTGRAKAGSSLSGAAGGAAAGALVGSIVPGIGTGIGAIVGGTAGAISGFVSESGGWKQALSDIGAKISEIAGPVLDKFKEKWDEIAPKVQEAWDAVKEALSAAWDKITEIWNAAVDVLSGIWETWGDTITGILERIFDTIWSLIEDFLDFIIGLFEVFTAVLTGDWEALWKGIKRVASAAWRGIVHGFELLWDTLWLVATTAWAVLTTWFGTVKRWLGSWIGDIKDKVTGVWDRLWSALTDTWDTFWSDLSGKFTTAKEAVGSFFEGLAREAKKPIKWVIENVYNKGIVPLWNAAARIFNSDSKLGTYDVSGWAHGGVLPGYQPGRDTIPAMLSPGEGILVPEAVKGLGGSKGIRDINAQYSKRKSSPKKTRDENGNFFADGGVVGTVAGALFGGIKGAANFLGSVPGKVMDFASGAVRAAATPLVNKGLEIADQALGDTGIQGLTYSALKKVGDGLLGKMGSEDKKAKEAEAAANRSSGGGTFSGPMPRAIGNWILPVPHSVNSRYLGGWRSTGGHSGVDFRSPYKYPIRAAQSGQITYTGSAGPYGKLTKIAHGNDVETYYAHQYAFTRGRGRVNKGDRIGLVDSTGFSTGNHLHWEVRVNGRTVDPIAFMRARAAHGGVAGVGNLSVPEMMPWVDELDMERANQSVSNSRSTNIENLHVNNPRQERASDSLHRRVTAMNRWG